MYVHNVQITRYNFFLITENFYLCVSGKLLPNTKNTKKNFLLILVYAFFTKLLIKYNNASTVSCEESKQNFEFKPKTEGHDGAFDHGESSEERLTPDDGTSSDRASEVPVNVDPTTASTSGTDNKSKTSKDKKEETRYKYHLCFGL